MASVAKWLRQWIVVPPFGGSIPLVRPRFSLRLVTPFLGMAYTQAQVTRRLNGIELFMLKTSH